MEEAVLPLFAYLAQCTTHSLQYMTYDNFMTNMLRFATAPDADKPVMLEYYFDIFSQRQQSLNRKLCPDIFGNSETFGNQFSVCREDIIHFFFCVYLICYS